MMAGFLLIGALLAYFEVARVIGKAIDAAARWHRERDTWRERT